MILDIKGSSKKDRKHIEESSYFFEKLLYKRRLPTLQLNIRLIDRLKETEGVEADCVWEDRRINPREYTIRLNTSSGRSKMITSLAHEMVHVKQYSIGELRDSNESTDIVYWMGNRYDCNKTHYYDWPWEIEASGREHGLYVRYMYEFNHSCKKWAEGFY